MQEAYALADRQQYARFALDFYQMLGEALLSKTPIEECEEIAEILFSLLGVD